MSKHRVFLLLLFIMVWARKESEKWSTKNKSRALCRLSKYINGLNQSELWIVIHILLKLIHEFKQAAWDFTQGHFDCLHFT